MALRDKILAASDAKSETVVVPEWGCSLQVRSLTNNERIDWEVACSKKKRGKITIDPFRLKTSLVVATCFDVDTGAKVFTDDDIDALAGKNAGVIERLFTVAAILSGVSEQDETDILGK